MKVNDFVLNPDGRPGYITEVHAKGKTAKVHLLGYYPIGTTGVKWTDVHPVKKLTLITRARCWEIAPKFPGIDC